MFSVVVLTGGRSRRMGRDKALIELDGRALAEISADAGLAAGASEVVLVGGDADALAPLGHRWVPDRWPGEGPLGAIVTALGAVDDDTVVILACDHVATSSWAIAGLVATLQDRAADVVIPVVDGRDQVLHAAWRRSSLTALEQRFLAGARSVREGTAGLEVARAAAGNAGCFDDADTPDDLLAVRTARYHRSSSEEQYVAISEIEPEELEALDPSAVQLIDVREPDEYEEARVHGAELVPLQTVPDAIDRLDRTRPVYLICASGGRSMRAAEFLSEQGFETVNIAGGTKGWIATGRAVDSGVATT